MKSYLRPILLMSLILCSGNLLANSSFSVQNPVKQKEKASVVNGNSLFKLPTFILVQPKDTCATENNIQKK